MRNLICRGARRRAVIRGALSALLLATLPLPVALVGGCNDKQQPKASITPAAGQRPADKQASTKPYQVHVEAAQGPVGQPVTATIRLVPQEPYKVNLEYPIKLSVRGPAAAAPAEQELRAKEAAKLDKSEAVFKPTAKLSAPGAHRFSATFKFSVCTETQCELKTEELTWMAAAK